MELKSALCSQGTWVTVDPQGQITVVSLVGASRCPEKWAPRLTSPNVSLAVFLGPWLLPFPLQKTPLFFRQLHALSSQPFPPWSHPPPFAAGWVSGGHGTISGWWHARERLLGKLEGVYTLIER